MEIASVNELKELMATGNDITMPENIINDEVERSATCDDPIMHSTSSSRGLSQLLDSPLQTYSVHETGF